MSEKPPHTPPRQMRIPDDEWLPFGDAAKSLGKPRVVPVREFIRWYMRRPGARMPTRPEAGPWSASARHDEASPSS